MYSPVQIQCAPMYGAGIIWWYHPEIGVPCDLAEKPWLVLGQSIVSTWLAIFFLFSGKMYLGWEGTGVPWSSLCLDISYCFLSTVNPVTLVFQLHHLSSPKVSSGPLNKFVLFPLLHVVLGSNPRHIYITLISPFKNVRVPLSCSLCIVLEKCF